MTIQTKTNSSDSTLQQPIVTSNDFIIHTMQDDLNGSGLPLNNNIQASTSVTQKVPTYTNSQSPQTISPFSDTPQTQKYQPQTNPNTPPRSSSPLVEIPNTRKSTAPSGNTVYKFAFSGIIIAIIAIMGSGYYFYSRQATKPVVAPPIITPEPPIKVEPPIIEGHIYSATNPNLLKIDSLSADDIKSQLIVVASDIKSLALAVPYEFIVVDQNNNPISLKTFSEAVKLNFSPTIFSKLDQDYSLYLYNDSNNVRLGIKMKALPGNKAGLETEMAKQEKTIVDDIAFIFLNYPIEKKVGATFTTSIYNTNNEMIRFLNVNQDKSLSIDYVVTSDALFIGSSKDTLRVIYLKQSTASTQPATSTSATTTTTSVATPITTPTATPATTNTPSTTTIAIPATSKTNF